MKKKKEGRRSGNGSNDPCRDKTLRCKRAGRHFVAATLPADTVLRFRSGTVTFLVERR